MNLKSLEEEKLSIDKKKQDLNLLEYELFDLKKKQRNILEALHESWRGEKGRHIMYQMDDEGNRFSQNGTHFIAKENERLDQEMKKINREICRIEAEKKVGMANDEI
ncbi:DUF3958 family protein [Listeria booriae]|nr:DUF3958 family protein [Listeria booriae]MBC1905457.1 DUF3958 family protein [Listeria booriae]MBC1914004.1 DUF3958 family protein [Listeria booriae]MBC2242482.1 DUF3958 family protein [Listeria booriae]